MARLIFAVVVILLSAVLAQCQDAPAMDLPEAPPGAQNGDVFPDKDFGIRPEGWKPSREQLDNMIRICDQLKEHIVYLNARHTTTPEALAWHRAADLTAHLEQKIRDEMKKHHEKFTCSEAKSILDHFHASNFQTAVDNLISGSGGVVPTDLHLWQVIENVELLRHEIVSEGLVNHEVEFDLKNLIDNLKWLKETQPKLKAAFDAVRAQAGSEQDCTDKFKEYIAILHSLSPHHLPDWANLHKGVQLLIDQCNMDAFVSGKEEL